MGNPNNRDTNKKREIGAYYTPAHVSQALCDWAICSSEDKVLEPGFGGCGFLEASRSRLLFLGNQTPNSNLFGCDKDKKAFEHLAEKIGPIALDRRFVFDDFLVLRPSDFSVQGFDAVIGNPPYVSRHNMNEEQYAAAVKAMDDCKLKLGARASLWAYFIIHALQFLKHGGRIAWVLPSSFIHAQYSKQIRQYFEQNFARVLYVPVNERLFIEVGAKESTVLLLADGWECGSTEGRSEVHFVASSEELDGVLASWPQSRYEPANKCGNILVRLDDAEYFSYQSIASSRFACKLENIARVKIGIVTGANDFFILDRSAANALNIPQSALYPILSKLNQTKGISLTRACIDSNVASGKRCLLLNTTGRRGKLKEVEKYLKSFPQDKHEKNKTFKKRPVWHQPNDNKIPDAFLSYMCHYGPRLVINEVQTISTNTIHRVFFNKEISGSMKKLVAISMLTTFSQLSSEIEGRSYGSGVLKLEPGEAKRVSLALPTGYSDAEIERVFLEINVLMEEGDLSQTVSVADDFILKPILGSAYESHISLLEKALPKVRSQRKRRTKF